MNGHGHFDIMRLERRSALAGLLGLGVCVAGALVNRDQFFHSYLLAYLFWVGISLGSLALVLLHHLVAGGWGFVIQRPLEAGARTLPLMAVLFLPVLIGAHDLYEWTHADVMAADEVLRHKSAYLNLPFYSARALVFFALWLGLAWLVTRWSAEQDRTGLPLYTRRLQLLAGPGLLIYVLTVTFAAIDWAMSLEPHWFSTVYGLLFIVGQVLATLAFVTIVVARLSRREPLSEMVTTTHFHDLGNLLLAFVMLWAYISFSQFLIIWSGNLPEEIPWYLRRVGGAWQGIGLFLIVFHFAIPFVLLLMREVKRHHDRLVWVAGGIFLLRLVDLYWLVVPAYAEHGPRLHWMDVAAVAGLGGMWLGLFLRHLRQRPLVPIHDPRLTEAVSHG